jgi:hypothetical protein
MPHLWKICETSFAYMVLSIRRVVLHLFCTEEWAAANVSVKGWPCPSCKLAQLASPGKSCCDHPCEFMCHAGRCPPCGYGEPLQGISSQSSEGKARHPRSKRTFEKMDEPIAHGDNTGKTHISISC